MFITLFMIVSLKSYHTNAIMKSFTNRCIIMTMMIKRILIIIIINDLT